MKKAVIFDMDGVLIDSEPIYLENFRRFFRNNNVTISENDLLKTAGASSAQIWRLVASLWPTPVEPAEIRAYYHKTHKKIEFNYKDLLFPDSINVLSELKRRNLVLALASSSSMKQIQTMLKETETEKYFTHIVSGEMFSESKPHPEIYLHTLENLGFEANECIAVEDSTYGIQSAKSAGIDTIAIRDTRFGYDQSLADYIIPSIGDILYLDILKPGSIN